MGWYGVQRAIIARDVDELAQELSPRRNPNDPGTALEIAVRQMSAQERADALEWADRWLRDGSNDCLRARGDARWQAVNRAERVLRWLVGTT